jgi:predicted nuclease of restriction endonuclease-like RecB superfamily
MLTKQKKGKTEPYSIVDKHISNKMEIKKGMYFQHNENKMMRNLKSTEPNSILVNSKKNCVCKFVYGYPQSSYTTQ